MLVRALHSPDDEDHECVEWPQVARYCFARLLIQGATLGNRYTCLLRKQMELPDIPGILLAARVVVLVWVLVLATCTTDPMHPAGQPRKRKRDPCSRDKTENDVAVAASSSS